MLGHCQYRILFTLPDVVYLLRHSVPVPVLKDRAKNFFWSATSVRCANKNDKFCVVQLFYISFHKIGYIQRNFFCRDVTLAMDDFYHNNANVGCERCAYRCLFSNPTSRSSTYAHRNLIRTRQGQHKCGNKSNFRVFGGEKKLLLEFHWDRTEQWKYRTLVWKVKGTEYLTAPFSYHQHQLGGRRE